jgi:spore coat protein U-like protein
MFLLIVSFLFAGEVLAQGCSVSAIPVTFGNYDSSLSSPLNAIGRITMSCEPGLTYTIKIDPGIHSGQSFNTRKMHLAGGSDTLEYNLYMDSARREIWGDGTGRTVTQIGTGTGSNQNFNVYGQIPGKQIVKVGSYSDSVTVTVEW